MAELLTILICVLMVALEIAVVVAIFAPHTILRALRSLLPGRRVHSSSRTT